MPQQTRSAPSGPDAPGIRPDLLVGRAGELAELADVVTACPLVTVAGPGGVGKSALAAAVAGGVAPSFPDGIVVVRLAEVRVGGVLDAISSTVELPRTGGGDRLRALARWLRPQRVLLLVDNCEHVLDELLPIMHALVDDAPDIGERRLHLLTTSRRPLGLVTEQVLTVAPLGLPAPDEPPERVAAAPSVALFLQRARGRDRAFVVPDEHWPAVGELCRRLDGLPLALELAGARAGALGVPRLLARLETDLALLGQQRTGGVDAAGAARSVEAVYDSSEQLLSSAERELLRALSVFTGSFDIAAVDAVVGEASATPLDGALAALVETSLVQRDHRRDRYRLLETVRQVAGNRWDDDDARRRAQRRHAEHYLSSAVRAGRGLTSGPESAWLETLSVEEANVRAALAHALDAQGPLLLQALAAAAALPLHWWVRGQHREGVGWLRRALDATGDAAPAELRAAALFGVAFLWAHDGDDWQTAATLLREALALLEPSGAAPERTAVLGYVLCLLGQSHAVAGEVEPALALTRRGRDVLAQHDDPWGSAFAEWNVGFAHQRGGDLVAAEVCYRAMLDLQTGHGSRLELMIAHNSLAELAEHRGDLPSAREHYARALELRHDLGSLRLGYVHGSLPLSLLALSRVSRGLGDVERARRCAEEGRAAATRMQDDATATACAEELELLAVRPSVAFLRRQGTGWVVGLDEESTALADSKGLRHLRTLVSAPGQPVAAIVLAGVADGHVPPAGDAGPVLDQQAVVAYRARLAALRDEADEADEADRRADPAWSARIHEEQESLVAELARGTGLGGRLRPDRSEAEKARINVTRTVRDAIERIGRDCPRLAEHLRSSVTTGTWCAYTPATPVTWRHGAHASARRAPL
ncbi:Predicted ATPase [Quadrisphaera granulorum]|uniref:Putative ATPase n=1 Tax=Quadrisphaera granulorum TaxID=317664 RepID=A0A316AAB4_9ACTN|nr:tetratricopeptide repeat protein [Quadrisphaera granulorum]PWJ53804.1 putative ATPase [Quadrisphaera granulorum]SZE96561.1 Predicted ATPase [Quadrisphaera granulorum]